MISTTTDEQDTIDLKCKNAIQTIEMNRHKYFLSKDAGINVENKAFADWTEKGYAVLFHETYSAHSYIQRFINDIKGCANNCQGPAYCKMTENDVRCLMGEYGKKS